MDSLAHYLSRSDYILALLGAGLSAPSGVPTFMDLPPHWHGYSYAQISSASTMKENPAIVWMFYESLRQTVLRAQPNSAHFALTALARAKPNFLAITQNIDNLSEASGHPACQLVSIHGSLTVIACSSPECQYKHSNDTIVPTVPALRLETYNITQPAKSLPWIGNDRLPICPKCRQNILRPGIVLFGEMLAEGTLDRIDQWLDSIPRLDLMLVIGTAAHVSSNFIYEARNKGARVAHFDVRQHDALIEDDDWVILGDVAATLPAVVDSALQRSTDLRQNTHTC